MAKRGRRAKGPRPEGLAAFSENKHSGRPKRFRRLRVEAEPNSDGSLPAVRNVYLESALVPPGFMGPANTLVELFGLGVSCTTVIDLIRWADQQGLPVTYEPAGCMAGYFRPKNRPDVQYLFDPC